MHTFMVNKYDIVRVGLVRWFEDILKTTWKFLLCKNLSLTYSIKQV